MKKFVFSINTKHCNFLKKLSLLSILLLGFVCITQNPGYSQTVIGGSTPDPSAMLDVQSNSMGVLFPRMTTAQRNSINAPATGLLIFNTTTECLEINLGTNANPIWTQIKCPGGFIVTLDADKARFTGSPLLPSVAASMNSARVPYTGGDGLGHSGQTVSSTGVTGLTAILDAGNFAVGDDSLTYNISGTPGGSGLAIFELNIGGKMSTLKIPVGCGAYVAANTWKVFSCYNLGAANTSANPFVPSWEINGGYWQWGRIAQAAPGPANATTHNEGSPTVWDTSVPANGAWQDGIKTGADPCPSGFRVPTKAQWLAVSANNTKTNVIGSSWNLSISNYTSGKIVGTNLMLPAAGYRLTTNGSLDLRDKEGYYWSSTDDQVNTTLASYLWVANNFFDMYPQNRTYGCSIRCIAE